MRSLSLVLVLTVASSCGQKAEAPPPPPPATASPAPAPAPAPATEPEEAKPPERPAPPTASKEQIAAYRTQLKAGRKLAKAGKWGEAVVAFKKALEALPGDARAEGELGWALFNAGDYPAARKASASAAKQAIEPSIRASSLYNLGRVEEAAGDLVTAARHYAESLILRPNKIVSDRLAKLGTEPKPDSGRALSCATAMPKAEICPCLAKAYPVEDEEPGRKRDCEISKRPLVAGLHVVKAETYMSSETVFLIGGSDDRWQVVAELEEIYNPGAFGIFEELGAITVKERTVSGHRVAQVSWSKSRSDSDMGYNEIETEDNEATIFCVLDAVPVCPVLVPTRRHLKRGPLFEGADAPPLDPDLPPSKPIDKELRLKATLGDDGVVSVVLEKGTLDEGSKGLVGQKKLW
jgi:hypothetical protein